MALPELDIRERVAEALAGAEGYVEVASGHRVLAGAVWEVLAAESPQGLWPGPVVDGSRTYYGRGDAAMAAGMEARGIESQGWRPGHVWDGGAVVQCRPPVKPRTEFVPVWESEGREYHTGDQITAWRGTTADIAPRFEVRVGTRGEWISCHGAVVEVVENPT